MCSYKRTVVSEIQYKPLTDKYGRDRSNQWEVMDRSKLAIKESVYITSIIKQYGQLRRMPTIKLKQIVKSHVINERKEPKTVKWATNVEIFEEEFANNEQRELVFNYRSITKEKELFQQINVEIINKNEFETNKNKFKTNKNEKHNKIKLNTFHHEIETIPEYQSTDQTISIQSC